MDSSFRLALGAAIWFFRVFWVQKRFEGLTLLGTNRPRFLPILAAFLAVLALVQAWAEPAMAARFRPRSAASRTHRITAVPAGATDPDKDAALIEDGATGKILYARNETALRHPASLT